MPQQGSTNHEAVDCTPSTSDCRERVRYFPGQLVTADDLTQDQHYWRQKLRRHNRLMHGWGVVCGLVVKQAMGDGGTAIPWTVTIGPGYAIDPYGDEIVVEQQLTVDLRCAYSAPFEMPVSGYEPPEPWCSQEPAEIPPEAPLYLAIRFQEYQTHPVQSKSLGCGCNQEQCEFTRIRDGYAVQLLSSSELPGLYSGGAIYPKGSCNARCPTCPDKRWIVLATVSAAPNNSVDVGFDKRLHLLMSRGTIPCGPAPAALAGAPNGTAYPFYIAGQEYFLDLSRPIATGFENVMPVTRGDGSRAFLPLSFTINPERNAMGESLRELLERESDRQYFDPKLGRVYTLPDLFSKVNVDLETKIKSVTDLVEHLRELRIDDNSSV